MSNIKTGIQPSLLVNSSGTPIALAGETPTPFTATQDLGTAALDATDAVAAIKTALWMALHIAGGGLDANQTLTVTFDSADGVAYGTLILSETLVAGTTDKFFSFPPSTLLRAGDHIHVHLTNAGEGAGNIAALTLMFGV